MLSSQSACPIIKSKVSPLTTTSSSSTFSTTSSLVTPSERSSRRVVALSVSIVGGGLFVVGETSAGSTTTFLIISPSPIHLRRRSTWCTAGGCLLRQLQGRKSSSLLLKCRQVTWISWRKQYPLLRRPVPTKICGALVLDPLSLPLLLRDLEHLLEQAPALQQPNSRLMRQNSLSLRLCR